MAVQLSVWLSLCLSACLSVCLYGLAVATAIRLRHIASAKRAVQLINIYGQQTNLFSSCKWTQTQLGRGLGLGRGRGRGRGA